MAEANQTSADPGAPDRWVILGKIGGELWHELRGEAVYGLRTEEKDDYASISKCKTFTPPSSNSGTSTAASLPPCTSIASASSGERRAPARSAQLDALVEHHLSVEHAVHRVVAEDDSVVVEHTETWHFETGESLTNRFVTVHEVRDGRVALNTDSTFYGGSDLGNGGGIQAAATESHGRPASMEVTLPPLATVVFKPRR